MNFWGLGAKVKVELEYFVLPRLSINTGAAYHYVYVFPPAEVDAYDSTTGEYYYSRSDRAIDAFFLDPFLLPDGTELTHDLFSANYFKIYAGVSFYF